MPRLTIIVPVYNGAEFVRESLERIRTQTFTDFELVVVDDGSSDATAAEVEKVARQDPRLTFLQLPSNGGVSAARRAAVAASQGEYLWLLDADDYVPVDAAARLIRAADESSADVVVGRARYVYGGDTETARPVATPPDGIDGGEAAFRRVLNGQVSGHLWNKLFRRSILSQADFVPARVHSDLALVASAIARARVVRYVPDHVYDYRIREGSIITTKRRRADSLAIVDESVARSAALIGIDPDADPDFVYFRCRYVTLSAIRDVVQSETDDASGLRTLRKRLRWREFAGLASRRDHKRLALAVTARWNMPAHKALLRLGAR